MVCETESSFPVHFADSGGPTQHPIILSPSSSRTVVAMSVPRAAAAEPSAASAASGINPPMNGAAPGSNLNPIPIPIAGPFRPLGARPPAPYAPPVYYMRRPPVFLAVVPPGAFPAPGMFLPRPPPPGGFVPYQGSHFHPFAGPRSITQYPVRPGPPGFPPSFISPPVGVFSHQRPSLIHGTRGPVAVARPPTPPVSPDDKPQFKVYVGKIAPAVDNDFVLCLLQVCGPVKSWRPVTNPIDGTPTGFGFCEFESAEGGLRARRLLSKLSVDGQELVLTINQATREYLEKYGEKNTTEEKAKETEDKAMDTMVSLADNEIDSSRTIPNVMARGAGDDGQMSTRRKTKRCWNVTEEDSDADKYAMQKIRSMIEERMKSKFPASPTPPVQPSAHIVNENGDDDTKKRRQRSSVLVERTSRRLREKDEHLGKRKAMELEGWKDREQVAAAEKPLLQIDVASSVHVPVERVSAVQDERKSQHRERYRFYKRNDEVQGIVFVPGLVSDKQNNSSPAETVGFELHAVQGNSSTGPPNFVATADFAKRISVSNPREEASVETGRIRRKSNESWAIERATERNGKYDTRVVNEKRKDIHEEVKDRQSTSHAGNKKILDAKQLLATVPKMKEELFAYDVNWAIYDKHGLHERMMPWISKQGTEIFGEESSEFVDYVLRSAKEHVEAPRMVELLASLLGDCAEMFVILMWRKLIFEIRKVEMGLA